MRWYCRKLADGLAITHSRPEFAVQLEDLQRICFPTLADDERFKSRHYVRHMELFGSGQFVALDGDRVIGATTTLRLDFDFDHVCHTFADIIQGGWLTSHQPHGEWLYGADVSVHPSYRGRGLANALYAARQEVVWKLGLKGQVTAGMMPGYSGFKQQISVDEYYGVSSMANFGIPLSPCRSMPGLSPGDCWRTIFTIRFVTITASCLSSIPPKTCEARRMPCLTFD